MIELLIAKLVCSLAAVHAVIITCSRRFVGFPILLYLEGVRALFYFFPLFFFARRYLFTEYLFYE